jgi:glycosyltransferase involved in cell wall biosynthesis
MIAGAAAGELDVIVVCNGCTDDTAEVAASVGPPVRVVETPTAGKMHALNIGDQAARGYPRIYADADVVIDIKVIRDLSMRLQKGDVLAVAPTARIDVTGCSWPVRAFYKIRARLPSASEGIGGSGVYALSEQGRQRFGRFPDLVADDGYVRIHFAPKERATMRRSYSTVFAPHTIGGLIKIKTRAHYGSLELAAFLPALWHNRGESNKRALTALFINPRYWPALFAYLLVTGVAKYHAKSRFRMPSPVWERDDTSRLILP